MGGLGRGRQLDGNPLGGERPLRAGDAPGGRRLRHQVRTGDLGDGQPAEQPEGERHPRLRRQHRVAGGEDETQQVVAHVVVERRGQVRVVDIRGRPADLGELLPVAGAPAQQVDGAVLGRRHQPGAGVVRHPVRRPPLQRDDQRVLGQLLGEADVADQARETRDDPGGLDPPDRLHHAAGIGGRHGHRSSHAGFSPGRRSPRGRTPSAPRPRRPSPPRGRGGAS